MVGFADRDTREGVFDPESKHERENGKTDKKPAQRTFNKNKNDTANEERKEKNNTKNNDYRMVEGMLFASSMDTRVPGVEIVHIVNPVKVKTRPTIGSKGRTGQRIIRTRLRRPPTVIMMTPASKRTRREKKPMKREMRRSRNM